MAVMTAPTFVFGLGDTLRMPVTYRAAPAADGTPGAPIDLTAKTVAGTLYTPGHEPIALSEANGGLVVTAAAGLMSFVVGDAVSATLVPDARAIALAEGYGYGCFGRPSVAFPTRLRVQVRDPAIAPAPGDIGTIALFAVRLYDPATVDLASLPVSQAATVTASPAPVP